MLVIVVVVVAVDGEGKESERGSDLKGTLIFVGECRAAIQALMFQTFYFYMYARENSDNITVESVYKHYYI